MKRVFLVSLLLIAVSPLYGQIYKWTDSSGGIHFSDQAHQGAEIIKLPEIQIYRAPTILSNHENPSATKLPAYKLLSIRQPENETTIRNNQGYVLILIEIQPALKFGDKLQLIYDGKLFGKPQISSRFILNDVERGSHSLVAQLIDKHENICCKSRAITFFMHRPRVK